MTTGDSFRCLTIFFVLLLASGVSSLGQQTYRTPRGSRAEQPATVNLRERALQQRYFSHRPLFRAGEKGEPSSSQAAKAISNRRAELRLRLTAGRSSTPLGSISAELPGFALRPYLPAGISPTAVVTGDFNKDGHQDFITANGYGNDLWLYLGRGDGTFQLPRVIPLTKGLSPVAIFAADLRHSGNLDLVVAEYDTYSIGVLLGNGDGTFGYEQVYSLPSQPAAVVIDDFNRDGKADIAVALDEEVYSVYDTVGLIATLFGDGTGSFAAPVITTTNFYSSAWNIASGDVNNDGLPDVLVTGPGIEGSGVWTNKGDGTFAPGQFLGSSGGFNAVLDARLADLNEDGCLDAAVADANGNVWTAMGNCSGQFTGGPVLQMGDGNSALALVDINHDGHLDVVTTGIPAGDVIYGDLAGDTLSVSFGDGHGNFTLGRNFVGAGVCFSPAAADFNEDGAPDFVTANTSSDSATVYLNDGSGSFGFPQGLFVGLPGVGVLNSPSSGLSFIDVNNDGKPDVALLDTGYGAQPFVTTVINDGSGKFTGPNASPVPSIGPTNPIGDYRLADFRNTGHPDFIAIGTNLAYSSGASYIVFMPGNGDGTFGPATMATPPGADGTLTTGDFNHDGKLDFAAVGRSGSSNLVTLFLGNGDGTFRSAGTAVFADFDNDVGRVFAGDFNRDGNLDVLVFLTANGYWTTASSAWEFLGDGTGNLSPGQKLFSPFQPFAVADISGDHWSDIVQYDSMWPDGTTETWGPARFTTYTGQADGTFLQAGTYTPYSGVPRNLFPYGQSGDPAATSMVADLNNDGIPDAIAFQTVSPLNYATYAQVLRGNGDGTLTPTYDLFPFYKDYSYPKYAHDLDGDGRADLVELDGNTSSMQVFKGAPAASFQLVLEDERISGSQGCGWIFPDVADSSGRTVALSSSIPGVNVPSSVSLPAGSLSQRFCYTLDPSYDWRQVFDIRAQMGTETAVAYGAQAYVVGFSETLSSSADQIIYAGESTTPITVTVSSSQGYTSTVNLSCGGLPQGASCVFGSGTLPVSPAAPSSTTLVVNTTSPGGGPVTILAADANVIARQSFMLGAIQLNALMPQGFSATTSPGTAVTNVSIYGKPPYTFACSGLPAGASCAFSGDQLAYPSTTNMILTVSLPAGLAPGSYPFAVNVTGGPQTVSIPASVGVVDFTVQPPATPSWGVPGGNAWASATAVGTSGFNGVVNFTCTTDFGGSCGTASAGFTGNSPAQFAVPVTVPGGAATGTHTLTLTGTYQSLVHTFSIPFVVADYSGTLDTDSVSLPPGSSTSVKATVNVTSGFSDTISFSCSTSAAIGCAFSPATVQATSGNPQTVTVTLTASTSAKSHPPLRRGTWLALATLLPFGFFAATFGVGAPRRRKAAALLLLLLSVAAYTSCGGGASPGSGGGGGSTTYSVTVIATAQNTNTTRTIGVVKVNVKH